MSAPAVPVFCRVALLAPGRRVDLALPADVPLAELVPLVLELLGEPMRAPGRPEPWRFTGATGRSLAPGATLAELGVLDGETLRIGPAVAPPAAPVFDDPVDALAALAPPGSSARWHPATVAVVATAAAAALLATARAGGDVAAGAAVVVGGLAAPAALAWAARAARTPPDPDRSRDGARSAAPVAACCAVLLAAATGWAVLPDPPGAAHVVLAAVAGGTVAALGVVAVREAAPVLLGAVVVALLAGAGAAVAARFVVDTAAVSAVVAAVALSAGPLLPRLALRLAGVPRPVVAVDTAELVAADDGPDLLPADELADRARLARNRLAGLTGGCAVVAAAAAPGAAAGGHATALAMAGVVVAVLLLRVRGFADAAPAGVHLVAGLLSGAALVGLCAEAAGQLGRPAGLVVLLGTAALGVRALRGPSASASPVARRGCDLAEGILTATALPLAVVAAGAFDALRALAW